MSFHSTLDKDHSVVSFQGNLKVILKIIKYADENSKRGHL